MTHQGSAWAVMDAATAFDDAILARADKIRQDRRAAFIQNFTSGVAAHSDLLSARLSGTREVDA